MLYGHRDKHPTIASSAWVAPDASICGDVTIGEGARIMHGARVIAEAGGRIEIGTNCIVMENAVVRATAQHPCSIGEHCLIGPMAHVVGATIENEVFVATGAAIFHGAILERRSEIRIHAVIHLRTRIPAGATVPIAWVAVGDPAVILPPDKHDEIWKVQAPLNFPQWVYGVDRETPDLMVRVSAKLSEALLQHATDSVIEPSSCSDPLSPSRP